MRDEQPDGRRHNRTDEARAARWAHTWRQHGWDIDPRWGERFPLTLIWRKGDGKVKWFRIEKLGTHSGKVAGIADDSAVGVIGGEGSIHVGMKAIHNGEAVTVTLAMTPDEAMDFFTEGIVASVVELERVNRELNERLG